MAAGRGKADFSPATKKIIQERALFRCVFPGCGIPTTGPGATPKQTASTGTACHIFSAAKKGPRGRGGLTDEQLSAPENGVWACATHGRLIDTNSGGAFPARLLHLWRDLQEAQIKRERDGQDTPLGWLDKIKIQNSALFQPDATLTFGRLTLIQGSMLGKTALCDWIAASLGARLPNRWVKNSAPVLSTLTAFAPHRRVIDAEITGSGLVAKIDGVARAEIPATISCLYVRQGSRNWSDEVDDDELLGSLFSVDASVIRRLLPDIQRNGSIGWRGLGFHHEYRFLGYDKDDNELYSKTDQEWVLRDGGPNGQTMRTFSGSEAASLLVELGAALARDRSNTAPAILILDGSEWPFDDAGMDELGEYLASQPFQTVLTAVGGWNPSEPKSWAEWKRYELRGPRYSATIAEIPW